jgi:hypothetical protein
LRLVNRRELQIPVRNGDDYDVQRPIYPFETPLTGYLFRRRLQDLWFIPLITMPMEAHCHLALRVGRRMKPGRLIFDGGDLDGRLKTLFDSLAVPKDEGALPDGSTGDDGEVLCLLADDNLITGLTIESYRLLGDGLGPNYVDVDIDVTITAMTPMAGTLSLLFEADPSRIAEEELMASPLYA